MLNKKKLLKSYIINFVAIVLMFVVINLMLNAGLINKYYRGIIMLICINIILATSLNLTTGVLGQLVLGHAGFMSVGAYAAAIFVKAVEMPDMLRFIISLIIGGAVAALLGVIVGIPALRLKGDYLTIITLGFGEIIRVIVENISITGGAQGLRSIPKLATVNSVMVITVLIIIMLFTLIRSRHGRAISSIREDEIAADASGIPTTFYKIFAFAFAAFLAGVAGGIYAQYLGILGAKTFGFMRSIEI
ncbi:MAG: branched-chain amino acid ABC transporter permease, partial [Oscillospiraceae bacterium]|nr:branched-chain amino acid ABC transporter permease [Oscillospiraceae bacterium]